MHQKRAACRHLKQPGRLFVWYGGHEMNGALPVGVVVQRGERGYGLGIDMQGYRRFTVVVG